MINLAPHKMFYSNAMGCNICEYCGLAEEYLIKGDLFSDPPEWTYGGRKLNREGIWVMSCTYWTKFAENRARIESQLEIQAGDKGGMIL